MYMLLISITYEQINLRTEINSMKYQCYKGNMQCGVLHFSKEVDFVYKNQ